MMKNLCLLLGLFAGISSAICQDLDHYTRLESQGKIPADFYSLASEKYDLAKNDVSSRDRKSQEEFLLKSTFSIDRMLSSGRVVFNDPLSVYAGKVLDELLKDDQALRSKLRVYVLKSSAVNAFAADNGIILITVGLISRLENEAQLAFILSHEITHFVKKHSLESHVENKAIDHNKGKYRKISFDERILFKSAHSKEKEMEADAEGLKLYLKSSYDLASLAKAFEMLKYAYLPSSNVVFDRHFFDEGSLSFPDSYFMEQVDSIGTIAEKEKSRKSKSDKDKDDDEGDANMDDDSRSTHPAISKRISMVEDAIAGIDNAGRKTFIVSETDFKNVKNIARFELSNLYLERQAYESAIYNSYALLKEYPNNVFLKENIAHAVYGLAKHSNVSMLSYVHTKHTRIEGESQQLYHLVDRTDSKELNVMALLYCWKLLQEYPDNEDLKIITDDLFESLAVKHYKEDDDFSLKPREEVAAKKKEEAKKDDADPDDDKPKTGKLSKLANKKKEEDPESVEPEEDKDFVLYALVENMKSETFSKKISEARKKAEEERDKKESSKEVRTRQKAEAKKRKKDVRKGFALDMEKVVFVSPEFMKIDFRKEEKVKHLDSESKEMDFIQKIRENAEIAGLDAVVLNNKEFKPDDLDEFNDLMYLNTWILNRVNNEDADVLLPDKERMDALMARYGTKYFCWTGVQAFRQRKYWKVGAALVSLLYPPLFPLGLYYAISPRYSSQYVTVVFDISTGEEIFTAVSVTKSVAGRDYIQTYLYDIMLQLARKK